jgi:SNF2-related domain
MSSFNQPEYPRFEFSAFNPNNQHMSFKNAPRQTALFADPVHGMFGGTANCGQLGTMGALPQVINPRFPGFPPYTQTPSMNFGPIPFQSSYNVGSMVDIQGYPTISQPVHAFDIQLPEIDNYANDQHGIGQDFLDIEISKENREDTPDGLNYPLYEHQKIALTWLKRMEEGPNKGGILADDMGLGKTISALALILSRPSRDSRRKV